MTATIDKKRAEHQYWRVIVTFIDGETSGNRVFKDRAKAEKFLPAKRNQRS
jgi:hypothetical protein